MPDKKSDLSVENLTKAGWIKNDDGYEKTIENRNPLNASEDSDIKLIIHQMFNTPMFAVLLPDGGMLNFVANSMKALKQFENSIDFYDPPF